MGLAVIIIIILFFISWLLYQRYKEGKAHRDYIKKDDRDDTDRMYDPEIFPNAFKRKNK